MKKVIISLLLCITVFNLCACGNNNTSSVELSKEEKQFLGTWISEERGGDLYSFRLLSSGKAIWVKYWDSSSEGVLVTEEEDVYSGEWIIDEDRILIFYSTSNALGNSAYLLNVIDVNTLEWGDHRFTKVE